MRGDLVEYGGTGALFTRPRVPRLVPAPPSGMEQHLQQMGVHAIGMLRQTFDALAQRNPDLARDVVARDETLVNLIDNAIKYGGEGRTVTIRAAARNQTLRLTVQDQGPGIDPAQGERIFERFYRLDAGRSRDRGGSGLGLAVVKHVVRVHHGAASFESLPAGGCAFHIDLPVGLPPAEPRI